MEHLLRTKALIGAEGIARLQQARIAVVGLGGVGGAALEALARSGIGSILAIDGDRLSATNLNRQLLATTESIGRPKAEVAAERAALIAPELRFEAKEAWITAASVGALIPADLDYIVDCIDDAAAKLALAEYARAKGIPMLMCMGTGNRLCSEGLHIVNFDRTAGCPLAKKMRLLLKQAGFRKLRALYSEAPVIPAYPIEDGGKRTVGSIAYLPAIAGMKMAEHIICRLIKGEQTLDLPK